MVKVSEISANWLRSSDLVALKESGNPLTATIIGDITIREADETPFGRKTYELPIELSNGEQKTFTINKTSLRNIAKEYGDETSNWKGKKIRFEVVRQNVMGSMRDVIYAYPLPKAKQEEGKKGKQVVLK